MLTRYHEFESLEHLLAERLRPGGDSSPVRCVVFGGTGAVGGAVVLELARLMLVSARYRPRPLRAEVVATGMSDGEISYFVRRLYTALEDQVAVEKLEPLAHYRFGDILELRFAHFRLAAPRGLGEAVEAARREKGERFEAEAVLKAFFASQPSPFLDFVEGRGFDSLLDGVVVGIPLPSVATYTLDSIDDLAAELGLGHDALNRVKEAFLQAFVRGLAVVRQKHARHVVMAHTTAVGGMYRVDEGEPEIRLGFDHSARSDQLADKKLFADALTRRYLDHGLEVLVTAAAIGIDAVEIHSRLPMVHGVRRTLEAAARRMGEEPSFDAAALAGGKIRLYPSQVVSLDSAEGRAPRFGPGKELWVDAAIRSGENGIFSVANCVALYHVMKVAIPEELAAVIVRRVVFGRERRRGWFQEGLAYYGETENAHFALKVLESDPRLVRAHLGAFAVQAFQALGSATHQARLHELGLVVLLLRLLELGRRFAEIPESALRAGIRDLDDFLWRWTRPAAIEDFLDLGPEKASRLLGALCEVRNKFHAAELIGLDLRRQGRREPLREKLLARIATRIGRSLATITSLGTPILYTSPRDGKERLRVGPYVAPLDLAVTGPQSVAQAFEGLAEKTGAPLAALRDWVLANNGFLDLRPHALATDAKKPGRDLGGRVLRTTSASELDAWLTALRPGSYFTTAGILALDRRLRTLSRQLAGRRVELGTANTWKNLFFRLGEGRHALAPGLVEICRMYGESLGKVTGTEVLWPPWGY